MSAPFASRRKRSRCYGYAIAVLPYASGAGTASRPKEQILVLRVVCVTVRTSRQTQGSLQRPIKVPRRRISAKNFKATVAKKAVSFLRIPGMYYREGAYRRFRYEWASWRLSLHRARGYNRDFRESTTARSSCRAAPLMRNGVCVKSC